MFSGIASAILSVLGGPIVNGIVDAYKAKLGAANTQDAQAAELARQAILAEIEAQKNARELLLAEQGRWWTASIRPLAALPVVIYIWKVIVWDTVLGLGTTPPLGGVVPEWAGVIVVTYFGGRTLEKISSKIANRFGKR